MNLSAARPPEGSCAVPATLEERLDGVRRAMREALAEAGRDGHAAQLVAVSKGHDEASIRAALAAGQRLFGENRVQETAAKWPALRAAFPDACLHMIGPLQSNKAAEALALFDVIETVDRPKLAAALRRALDRDPALARRGHRFLVQVNTGEEPQKGGVAPQALPAFLEALHRDHHLPVCGLMAIPPVDEDPAPHFALLAKLAARHGLRELSMGMSADFETAIQFGATLVRVGTAIFGARKGGVHPSGPGSRDRVSPG